jgi:single-stranded-DNA-specific exonuclease
MLEEAEVSGVNSQFGESLSGMRWDLYEDCFRTTSMLTQQLNISEALSRVLSSRGIRSSAEALSFLDPKMKDLIQDPFLLKDMDKAAERVSDAILANQKITIFGDYDVDGATSSALLRRFFRMINIDAPVYIPSRMKEGYGPNPDAMRKIREGGSSLVITVDCGTMSFDAVDAANEVGLDVVIIDHHLALPELPKAVAVVNPNRIDEDYSDKTLAAVGVSFMLAIAVRSILRKRGWFAEKGIEEPDLMILLDLVALGTVCDVMPLQGLNRAFVKIGLKVIASRNNIGLATLSNIAKITIAPQAYHLGFVFGPRINAGGRVGEGMLGTTLLSTEDPIEALKIAQRLEELNEERKIVEGQVLEDAIFKIESRGLHNDPVILVDGEGWHIGILGIIASRIKERYNKPSAIVAIHDGVGKGSARSISGVDLGTAIASAKADGIITEGGGHAMAGGFTVKQDNISLLRQFFKERFEADVADLTKVRSLLIDAVIDISAANRKMFDDISKAGPFGSGNSQPRFAIKNLYITKAMQVGINHVMFIVCDNMSDSKGLKCINFKGAETPLGQFILNGVGKRIDVAGFIQANYMDQTKVDFVIEDVAVRK